ncbi:MAG: putative thiosulfate sulfurtransferase [Frankiales bacterium]|nr:putative thiosulfate sulfurtransferase [Frankiales bacterium]
MLPPFVDASWLADHPEAVLADCRSYIDDRDEHEAYLAAHLPGAVFVDLNRYLAAPPTKQDGRHPMPSPEVFAEGMSAAGIGDDATVIGYDDDNGVMAARLVWMLRVTGHRAAVLDGGITAWRGSVEHGEVRPEPAHFTPVPWPAELVLGIDEVEGLQLVDARPAERFRGEMEPIDARPGHIPGSQSLPCRESTDARGALLPVPELRERYADLREGWVSYCGSGVTACHALLVAEHLHLPQGRLYAGSWSQWAATDRPAELG